MWTDDEPHMLVNPGDGGRFNYPGSIPEIGSSGHQFDNGMAIVAENIRSF